MKYSANADSYTHAESGVLKNRFNLYDAHELARVESGLFALRAAQLALKPIGGHFDLAHLQAIHKHLFGDVYEWAGELRSVDISKGTTRFAHHARIAPQAALLSQAFQAEHELRGLAIAPFCKRAAHYLAEWNVLHPFREGNGRSMREMFGLLAHACGYHISWHQIAPERFLAAMIQSYHGDETLLADLLHANTQTRDTARSMLVNQPGHT
ncbi:Fic family protein [Pusillimonas sp. CC-YST705]|uniref:protein adenylyltransferase n=1 Tax=Mesopusillimonas faecipullorum TaxID=2755040 RepID=A0ABS8CF77_9BURK|nr:Fic family protein [Mesopusillimonas faecipullorum]MCB5364696.1 Fic family protein [Mesopusillimonas faecipullorum]